MSIIPVAKPFRPHLIPQLGPETEISTTDLDWPNRE